MDQWTRSYFGPLYGELYQRHLIPRGQTRAEVDFLQQTFALAGKSVLDVAGGYGRHACLLARDNAVTLLDINGDYLLEARRSLPARLRHNLLPLCADMYAMPLRGEQFDCALLLFNSFGYLQDERDKDTRDAVLLREIARVLRPHGELIVEAPNRRTLMQAVARAPRRHLVTGRYELREEFSYDAAMRVLHNHTLFRSGSRQQQAGYSMRLYTRTELAALLREAGFRVLTVFGSYSGDRFSPERSDMMLMHAQVR